ncbi:serine protease [Microvirga sp. TS319]|uniref:S1 family peptidase n=1 Tax=Microvirga sp. TS319 TaxID=3241165 RepID=UPI003519E5F8
MGAPLQVRTALCAVALALLAITVGPDGAVSRASAQESSAKGSRASCVDPSAYTRSVVSISRYFDKARRDGSAEIIGERATAWFYTSPRILVTAAHFANTLPVQGWQDVELRQTAREGEPGVMVLTPLRVVARGRLAGGMAEDVAILELRDPFPHAQVLEVETEVPPKNAMVLVLGYPGGRMQTAHGFLRDAATPASRYAGLAMIEIQGSDRLLLNVGTSGSPVLDCVGGRVIGVLNALLTLSPLPVPPSDNPAIPTPKGSPTNTAVPAATLTAVWNRTL